MKQLNSAEAHNRVVERRDTCPGFPVERSIRKKDRTNEWTWGYMTCVNCKSKTKWFCLTCRHAYCMDNKPTKTRTTSYYSGSEKTKGGDNKRVVYGKSCFHLCHEDFHKKQHLQLTDEKRIEEM